MRWTITSLAIVDTPLIGTVAQADWRCEAPDGRRLGGRVTLRQPDPAAFTALDQLTEPMVLQWVWDLVAKSAVEAELSQATPTVVAPPWAPPEPPAPETEPPADPA